MKDIPLPSSLLLAATEAALLAGSLLQRGFGTEFEIKSKTEGRQNLVTEYDHAAENLIIKFLNEKTPGCSFLAEESGKTSTSSDLLWIIDPLDGTVNFAHRIPFFSVSIAAAWQKEVIAAVVYHPILHEIFTATKAGGALLNGQKLKTSGYASPDQAILTTGFPSNVEEDPLACIETFTLMLRQGYPVRRLGSAALDLAYVSAGRFDAFWEVQLQPWDMAAGALLVKEAGGLVTNYAGEEIDLLHPSTIVATNGALHPMMLKVLAQR